ncbi:uncharacterized protein KNAG_0G00280 [Huiozyma naganishii CBS 8797]|uniref:Protein kinase domain-containing protein n=1 Tax=Huiozyma naganishii (strain ATCC MYA-139 / BCRC 22969 / CBS 8797 / KCTC 17520 / NBRC 10181 / NCYC 3082 / Yp74L-3) TaxID=1071383 RepID=J7S8T4_HUIN7|nr:hypothetical protein KNAG_0G00280 [Kazachstania naganishii CBS 8797]CCK71086.1 hypothetical protein KNAG_0G00280 [Kazachstania naganishii CBS 8797]
MRSESNSDETKPVSGLRLLGRKLLRPKTFDSQPKKVVLHKKPLKKRSTLPANAAVNRNQGGEPLKPTGLKPVHVEPAKGAKPIVYNPYGINNSNGTVFSNANSATNSSAGSTRDASFYLHEGGDTVRVLKLPLMDPNELMPEQYVQSSVHLFDNFKFESDHKNIGSGGSAEVKKVVSKRTNTARSKIYAFKKLNMIYTETDEQYYKRCMKEFVIGRHLTRASGYGSVNIIGVYQLCKVPTTTILVRGWGYVMELGRYDLFSVMTRVGWKNVDIAEKYCIFKQVANGVKFMHDNGVAHRDLKPENVLFCEGGVCKITDFGISAWSHETPDDNETPIKMCSGMIGSPPYAPPEVMVWAEKKGYPDPAKKPFNPLSLDCFSLGIILMVLTRNFIPFLESCDRDPKFREYEAGYEKFIKYGNKNFKTKGCYRDGPGKEYKFANWYRDTDVARVAWRLADPDPETRYTMEDLLNDPWFQKIDVCIDPSEGEHLRPMEPELYNQEELASVAAEVVAAATPKAAKPRSMIDIASTPQTKPKHGSSTSPISVPSVASISMPKELSLSKSNTPSTSPASSHNSLSGSDSQDKKDSGNLFTVKEEENTGESPHNCTEDSSQGETAAETTTTQNNIEIVNVTKKISELSTKMDNAKKHKKVKHHHLNVVNSISGLASSSFSESISSIASSTGSSSQRRW